MIHNIYHKKTLELSTLFPKILWNFHNSPPSDARNSSIADTKPAICSSAVPLLRGGSSQLRWACRWARPPGDPSASKPPHWQVFRLNIHFPSYVRRNYRCQSKRIYKSTAGQRHNPKQKTGDMPRRISPALAEDRAFGRPRAGFKNMPRYVFAACPNPVPNKKTEDMPYSISPVLVGDGGFEPPKA